VPGAATTRLATQKKSLKYPERDEEQRQEFRQMTAAFDLGKYVFIDEMGSKLSFTRLYGRAAPGQRVVDEVPGERGKNVSPIGAIALDGVRTGLSVSGAIDGETMLFFVEELLVPTLKRGDIVVLDHGCKKLCSVCSAFSLYRSLTLTRSITSPRVS
jgi:hypothetical protein